MDALSEAEEAIAQVVESVKKFRDSWMCSVAPAPCRPGFSGKQIGTVAAVRHVWPHSRLCIRAHRERYSHTQQCDTCGLTAVFTACETGAGNPRIGLIGAVRQKEIGGGGTYPPPSCGSGGEEPGVALSSRAECRRRVHEPGGCQFL